MDRVEKIRVFFEDGKYIDNFNAGELVSIHNDICEWWNDDDSKIYSMNDFHDILDGADIWDIACMVAYGNFIPTHDWFWFNGYGRLVSSSYGEMFHKCIESISEYAEENPEEFFDYLKDRYFGADDFPDFEDDDEDADVYDEESEEE